ncbi:hypothetical protein EDB19DRAFT_1750475 [Suillus lakei]|nr:hypothetical protein EDB19DRAFT_1750475 [Suillus lakei]
MIVLSNPPLAIRVSSGDTATDRTPCPSNSNGPPTNAPFCTSQIRRVQSRRSPMTIRRLSLKNATASTSSSCMACTGTVCTGTVRPLTLRYAFLAISSTPDMSCWPRWGNRRSAPLKTRSTVFREMDHGDLIICVVSNTDFLPTTVSCGRLSNIMLAVQRLAPYLLSLTHSIRFTSLPLLHSFKDAHQNLYSMHSGHAQNKTRLVASKSIPQPDTPVTLCYLLTRPVSPS